MRPEAGIWRQVWIRVVAALYQLQLELKVVTGGRAAVLLIVTAVWFGLFYLWAVLRDEPWAPETYYNMMLVIPGSILAVALSMVAVIGDRDTGQLETTFVSPTGRRGAWVQRFVAVFLASWGSTGVLSLLSWLLVDPGHRPLAAWLHAFVPLLFVTALTIVLSLAFKSSSVAGLCSAAYLISTGMFGEIWTKGNYWFNPLAQPSGQDDPQAFFRMIVFNRSGYLLVAGLLIVSAFALLQRRERLL